MEPQTCSFPAAARGPPRGLRAPVLGASLVHISSFQPWNGPDRWQLSHVSQVGKTRHGLGTRNLVRAAWLLPPG